MTEFLGSTGAKVVINAAPMEDAIALKCAIHAKIAIPEIDLKSLKKGTKSIIDDMDIKILIEAILQVDADPEVNKCFMKCLERSTYDREKITARTFDDPENRKDYYKIITECFKVNILPFYEGLISEWSALISKLPNVALPQQ